MVKLWIIRHGQTLYNKFQHDWTDLGNSLENAQFRWDRSYCDAPLSEIGIEQASSKVDQAHSLNVTKVYVSPLRRALQTCDILFRNHPNTPKIVVHPLFTELIHNSHDIPTYSGTPYPEFSHFDWSNVPNHFYVPEILNNQYTQQLIGMNFEDARIRLLDIMREINPLIVESQWEMYDRTRKAREIIRSGQENVGLVTHSSFLTYFMSELNENREFIGLKRLNNLEMVEFEF
ncbi:unnamed protein product [Blepharisma stoltei]|uniref:Phosphoglycerate mutase n=1 Tax=Blepharisma stoltei TaxID=1481888 RepID=A0AAU9ISM0_9CILI|nr:unnamed protein product [Blepharisma stoltei]